jgi:hypothetical protein
VLGVIKASAEMAIEAHSRMENSDNDDVGHRRPEEQDMRADGELAIAGANLIAGKPPARVFRHRHCGALNAAQICLRLVEAESFE